MKCVNTVNEVEVFMINKIDSELLQIPQKEKRNNRHCKQF